MSLPSPEKRPDSNAVSVGLAADSPVFRLCLRRCLKCCFQADVEDPPGQGRDCVENRVLVLVHGVGDP